MNGLALNRSVLSGADARTLFEVVVLFFSFEKYFQIENFRKMFSATYEFK